MSNWVFKKVFIDQHVSCLMKIRSKQNVCFFSYGCKQLAWKQSLLVLQICKQLSKVIKVLVLIQTNKPSTIISSISKWNIIVSGPVWSSCTMCAGVCWQAKFDADSYWLSPDEQYILFKHDSTQVRNNFSSMSVSGNDQTLFLSHHSDFSCKEDLSSQPCISFLSDLLCCYSFCTWQDVIF